MLKELIQRWKNPQIKSNKDLDMFLDRKSNATKKLAEHFSKSHKLGTFPKRITEEVDVRNRKFTKNIAKSFSKLREETSKICGTELTYAEVDWLIQYVLGPISVTVSKEKKRLPTYTMYTMLGIELSETEKRSLLTYIEGGIEE